jgi:hypothetical protein
MSGHNGTMSQIACIQMVSFGRNFETKKRALPQETRVFCEKLGPLLPHYEDLFVF